MPAVIRAAAPARVLGLAVLALVLVACDVGQAAPGAERSRIAELADHASERAGERAAGVTLQQVNVIPATGRYIFHFIDLDRDRLIVIIAAEASDPADWEVREVLVSPLLTRTPAAVELSELRTDLGAVVDEFEEEHADAEVRTVTLWNDAGRLRVRLMASVEGGLRGATVDPVTGKVALEPAAPVSTPSVATPTSTPTPPSEWSEPRLDVTAGALLVDWGPRPGWQPGRPGAGRGALVPLHPETAEDLPGYVPIDLGHAHVSVLSPDGRLVALGRSPTQDGRGRIFEVLEVDTWEVREFPDAPHALGMFEWDPEGTRVYSLHSDCSRPLSEGRCGRAWEHELWAISVESGRAEVLAELDFWATSLHVAPAGDRLYAFGYRTAVCCGIDVEGPPFVAVIDTATGEVLAEILLPDILVGQRFEEPIEDHATYNVLRTPGLALAPDGTRFYVAHADEDRVTVVDLERMAVAQVAEIGPPQSAFSRLRSWIGGQLASRAEAKSALYQRKQAEVSPDGRHLYVTGSTDVPCAEVRYFACVSEPLGLSVVDTESLQLVGFEPDVSSVTLTPDGRRLLTIGFHRDSLAERAERTTGYGLKILDARTFEVLSHLRPGAVVSVGAVSPDGRYTYLLSDGDGWELDRHDVLRCESDCRRITVADIEAGEIIATRSLDGFAVRLISLGTQPGPDW